MFTRGFEKEEGISDSSDCFCACVGPGARRKGARVFFKVFAPDAVAVLQNHNRERLTAFADLVKNLRLAGLPKEELSAILDTIYTERSDV